MTRTPTPTPTNDSPVSALVATGPGELPDCRLPEPVRRCCKQVVRQASESLNSDALMFLAAAAEVEARRKHAEEARA